MIRIWNRNRQRVTKDGNGFSKGYGMLLQITSGLAPIP
jgi:hypothetical protein